MDVHLVALSLLFTFLPILYDSFRNKDGGAFGLVKKHFLDD